MPRIARNVFTGIPHHISQRGNRREDVFFTSEDREVYLSWLREYCQKWSGWLALSEDEMSIEVLRRNIEKGLPCGSDDFISNLEKIVERNLRFR